MGLELDSISLGETKDGEFCVWRRDIQWTSEDGPVQETQDTILYRGFSFSEAMEAVKAARATREPE